MSNLTVKGNASGTGTVILEAPNTNSNRTITLPDAATTLVGTDATQTLTNKTIQGGALTLGTAVASTSGTAIDFTGIPSWAKRVTVMFQGLSTNGTSTVQVQLGAGSILSSGYLGAAGWSINGGGIAVGNNSSGFRIDGFAGAGNTRHGMATLALVSSNAWVFSSVDGLSDSAGVGYGGGSVSLSGTLDRVRITTVNGTDTFDAGTINIMWEG